VFNKKSRDLCNLLYPQMMRQVFRSSTSLTCGTLKIPLLRNKVDDVVDMINNTKPNILGIIESWHEGADCVCIARLRASDYDVIEEAHVDRSVNSIAYIKLRGFVILARSVL